MRTDSRMFTGKATMATVLVLTVFLLTLVAPAAGQGLLAIFRNPVVDVQRITGDRLGEEEKRLVSYVMAYYVTKFGYVEKGKTLGDSIKRMKDEEYSQAVKQAAKVCKNPAAVGVLKLGKAGEKGLTALIALAEEAAKAAGDWLEM